MTPTNNDTVSSSGSMFDDLPEMDESDEDVFLAESPLTSTPLRPEDQPRLFDTMRSSMSSQRRRQRHYSARIRGPRRVRRLLAHPADNGLLAAVSAENLLTLDQFIKDRPDWNADRSASERTRKKSEKGVVKMLLKWRLTIRGKIKEK